MCGSGLYSTLLLFSKFNGGSEYLAGVTFIIAPLSFTSQPPSYTLVRCPDVF